MSGLTPERRAELLAAAGRDDLVALADRCAAADPRPTVTVAPEVGTILLEVREPVAHDRFHLGEVLACRAEVSVPGGSGWALRLGDDRLATLAAAVCDAEVDASRPLAAEVEDLCKRATLRLAAERAAEWRELAPTQVAFEELD
ncbi:MAG: phosphonate C-P lyase system protein PhnG [Chloroflexi bacterium]|nr:phosphonate C-P lyase system protein PhnG [Chloroflexota bacterium]MCI0582559.1 phosphonate C-P lyase system protein PhnG [Chloroflexota bacterium]